jgi:ankyrin repeat protein
MNTRTTFAERPISTLRSIKSLPFWVITGTLLLCLHLPLSLLGQTATGDLFEAVAQGNTEKVKSILDQKTDINAPNENGRTPLMIAVMNGRLEVVKLLLERGAEVDRTDKSGKTARKLAASLGEQELVNLLDQAAIASDPQMAFFDGVKKGDIEGVGRALDKGADVNATLYHEKTALMSAAASHRNDHALLKLLLDREATVNAVDDDGRTAFDHAELPGEATDGEAQRLLAEKGAITNAYAAQRLNDSLRNAVQRGDAEMVGAILARGADPNLVGKVQIKSVLMTAAEAGELEVVRVLLARGANPNRTMVGNEFWQGRTALFFAAEQGSAQVAKALIEKGANVNAQQKASGVTPLILASMAGRSEVVSLLLEKGANPNTKDYKGRTAFALADGQQRLEIEQLLIKAGAKGPTGEAVSSSDPTVSSTPTAQSAKPIPPLDSKTVTKAEWKRKYYARFTAGSIVLAARFKSVFGEPSRTQTVAQEAYWYYECSDGVIQVILNDPSLFGNAACIQSLNDY